MLTIAPPPRARMCGAAARAQKNAPLTLTPRISSQASPVRASRSENGACRVAPALLTRKSIPPCRATISANPLATAASSETSIWWVVTGWPSRASSRPLFSASSWERQYARAFPVLRWGARVDDRQAGAPLDEEAGDLPPEAGPTAGHDRDLAPK